MRLLAALCLLAAAGAAKAGPPDPQRHIIVNVVNPVTPGLRGAASTWRGWDWSGGYRASLSAARIVDELARDYALSAADDWTIRPLGLHCVLFRLADGATPTALLARLAQDRRVESVQALQMFATAAAGRPNWWRSRPAGPSRPARRRRLATVSRWPRRWPRRSTAAARC